MPRASAPFPWPGNKGGLADWILDIFPHHDSYLDVFGGSGALLFEKARSQTEVYNDADADLAHFMRTLRDEPDELSERLQMVPYARELHDQWTTRFFEGHRPDDSIERAARYYFVRRAQYGGEAAKKVGFRATVSGRRNPARQWKNSISRLPEFSRRLQGVEVTCRDYSESLAKTNLDRPTVIYCDPPYRDSTTRYRLQTDRNPEKIQALPSFDFGAFATTIAKLAAEPDGPYVIVSTDAIPGELEFLNCVSKDSNYSMNAKDGPKDTTEHLLTNFDPEAVSTHSENATLSAY